MARAPECEADGGRLAVVGDSAGGNLAAVTTLMARDRGAGAHHDLRRDAPRFPDLSPDLPQRPASTGGDVRGELRLQLSAAPAASSDGPLG